MGCGATGKREYWLVVPLSMIIKLSGLLKKNLRSWVVEVR